MAVAAPEQMETRLRSLVTRLAEMERGTASPGERAAAEVVGDELRGAVEGRVLGALGALLGRRALRLCGAVLSGLNTLGFLDIASRAVVPGANDNATGCAVIVELARAFASEPLPDTRVLLVSTAEESM